MKTSMRLYVLLSMVLGLFAVMPLPAQAQTSPPAVAGPSMIGGGAIAASPDVRYSLNAAGLQAAAAGLDWSIALKGVGRGSQVADAPAAQVTQADTQTLYARGNLLEWYRSTPIGMEQGFTVGVPPEGSGPLVLQLDVSTNASAMLDANGTGLSFTADGQTLRYDGLQAQDANGVALDAKMSYSAGQVVIQVDDAGAAYPLNIDPFIYKEQKVVSRHPGVGDYFGTSVAIDGNTAIVGAPGKGPDPNQSTAYVFVLVGSSWRLQQKLVAPGGTTPTGFGGSVDISGNTAIVGAQYTQVGTNPGQGAAYVFVRSGAVWTRQKKLVAADGATGDKFGASVAIEGNTVVVGAPDFHVDNVNPYRGAAYVFARSGTVWTQQAQLLASDWVFPVHYGLGDHFGTSVAVSGKTAVIGAPGANAGAGPGAAYVFVRSSGHWTEQQKLIAPGSANFGWSVAVDGNSAIVAGGGRALIFLRSRTTWNQQGGDLAPATNCCSSVAILGNKAAVGMGDAVMVFRRSGAVWTQEGSNIMASDTSSGAGFGTGVAVSTSAVLVGSPYMNVSMTDLAGAAYFYSAPFNNEDLAVSVGTAGPHTITTGDTTLLNVSVFNNGPTVADFVAIGVTLPKGLTYVSSAASNGTFDPATGLWAAVTAGTSGLSPGTGASLTITAQAKAPVTRSKTLTFSALSPYSDPNNANNSASFKLTVQKTQTLLNGGFNAYPVGEKIPTDWAQTNFALGDGKDTLAAEVYEGTASVKIANGEAKTKTLTQTVTLAGVMGDPFIFSYWVMGNAVPTAGFCRAEVQFFDGATSKGTKKLGCGATGTFAYQKRTLSFAAPDAYTSVLVKFTYSGPGSTIWFDGASLLR